MKNILKKIKNLNYNNLEIYVFQLYSGIKLISLVKEKKKHYRLYSPMLVESDVNEDGKRYYNLVSYQPMLTVDSTNTILHKDQAQVFAPSEIFKKHYLQKLNTPVSKDTKKSTKKDKNGLDKPTNNVIDFSNFRKHQQQKANLSVVVLEPSGNTDGPPDVA